MSSSRDIQAVYQADIAQKTHQVARSRGAQAFFDDSTPMHIFDLESPPLGDGEGVINWRRRRVDSDEDEA